jgi:hypothetical protein
MISIIKDRSLGYRIYCLSTPEKPYLCSDGSLVHGQEREHYSLIKAISILKRYYPHYNFIRCDLRHFFYE